MRTSHYVKRMVSLSITMLFLLVTGVFGSLVAFAAEGTPTTADVYVTKNFVMDKNLTLPNETFTYTVMPVSVNGVAYNETSNPMPAITVADIVMTGTSPTTEGTKNTYTKTGKITVPAITEFTHAGEYVYTITEKTPEPATDGITYSQAVYTLRVYIENDGTNLSYKGVTVEKTTNDAGTDVGDRPKVEATDGKAGLLFISPYVKNNGSLDIKKVVTGTFGDKTRKFPFTVALTLPGTNNTMTTVNAEIWKDGAKVTGSTDVTFTFAAGAATANADLADGEYLHFAANLPIGTTYTVTEKLGENAAFVLYTPSASVVYNNTTAVNATAGTKGANYEVTGTGDGNTINTTVGENANSTTITNTYDEVTPTGILIDNLPYILLIAVSVAGLALYLVGKRRKQEN